MKYLYCFFLSLLLLNTASGQDDLNVIYNRAIQSQIDKNFNQAIQQFDSVITGSKDVNLLKMSLIFKSQCLRYTGKYEASIESIDKAIEIDPNDIASYFDKIHTLEDQLKYSEIIDLCEKILKWKINQTDKCYAYYYLGKAYTAQAKYKMAIYYYDKAIDIDKSDYLIYFYRGFVYEKIQLNANAIRDYSKSIELNNKFAQGFERRGIVRVQKILMENDDTYISLYGKDACADFNKSLELGSQSVGKWIDMYCK